MVEAGKRARMEYKYQVVAWEQRYEEQADSLQRVFQITGFTKRWV